VINKIEAVIENLPGDKPTDVEIYERGSVLQTRIEEYLKMLPVNLEDPIPLKDFEGNIWIMGWKKSKENESIQSVLIEKKDNYGYSILYSVQFDMQSPSDYKPTKFHAHKYPHHKFKNQINTYVVIEEIESKLDELLSPYEKQKSQENAT
jgi:hypothetical protein